MAIVVDSKTGKVVEITALPQPAPPNPGLGQGPTGPGGPPDPRLIALPQQPVAADFSKQDTATIVIIIGSILLGLYLTRKRKR